MTRDYGDQQDLIIRSKILAYSLSTWRGHISAYQGFVRFCNAKQIEPVECTPPSVTLYLLELAGKRKSIGVVNRAIAAITLINKWLIIDDISADPHIVEIRKFLNKTCPKTCNLKQAIGVKEIRKVWDKLELEYKDLTRVPDVMFRSFVLMVTQHASFCRYSDLAGVKLDDLLFSIDYFKVHITVSKTDQAGHGQSAFIPCYSNPYRCPQKLMCLFLHKFHPDPEPDVYLFPALE
jgi:site-specific recombinase XerD